MHCHLFYILKDYCFLYSVCLSLFQQVFKAPVTNNNHHLHQERQHSQAPPPTPPNGVGSSSMNNNIIVNAFGIDPMSLQVKPPPTQTLGFFG